MMQYVCTTCVEGRLLAMNLRKLEKRVFVASQTSSHSRNCHSTRKMENAIASLVPETINDKAHDGDDDSLTPMKHEPSRHVGKAMYLSYHRPDIQHIVNTLSRSMRNPTMIAMRRLKKLTRYLA